ncbi:MAG: metal ABC transporter permease, partial [Hydrogenophaga sp.]|nr:metal ABC transporter permease [Hydrogenophaga sp.]
MNSTPWWPALDAWIATSAIFGPFAEFGFMRRALVGCVALSLSAAPVGVFLMLRRMSLTGDAMAHAILPGAAIGYLVSGLSLTAMTIGGIVAGLTVAVGSGLVARNTVLREDASLAAFYLLSLALGVLIVSVRGNSVDLLHVLFGTVLALDDAALALLGGISAVTLVSLAVLYRPLVLECLDPGFLRSVSRWSPVAHYGFLGLLVI